MNYWVFTINDSVQVFDTRLKQKSWPIFPKTSNRYNIKKGDHVVFYKAGYEGKKFLGTSVLNSNLKKTDKIDFEVELRDIKIWKKGLDIFDVMDRLEFIKNKRIWGNYMMGGIRALEKKDFLEITNTGTKSVD